MEQKTELCLTITLASADGHGDGARERLAAMLHAVPTATVVIVPDIQAVHATLVIASLVDVAQKCGAATLIANDWVLARAVQADGVHLAWSKDQVEIYRSARAQLGNQFIIGADAGRSRHEAMTLGEAGADYVAFGIPPHVDDRETAEARQIELVAWWTPIFEIPCVASDVMSPQHAQRLAMAGADFVALAVPSGVDAGSARDWIRDIVATMTAPEVAA